MLGRVLFGVAAGVVLVEVLAARRAGADCSIKEMAGQLGTLAGDAFGYAANVCEEAVDQFQARFDEATGGRGCWNDARPEADAANSDDRQGV